MGGQSSCPLRTGDVQQQTVCPQPRHFRNLSHFGGGKDDLCLIEFCGGCRLNNVTSTKGLA